MIYDCLNFINLFLISSLLATSRKGIHFLTLAVLEETYVRQSSRMFAILNPLFLTQMFNASSQEKMTRHLLLSSLLKTIQRGMKNENSTLLHASIVSQIPEWKKCLLDMANNAKKFLNFSVVLKTSGNTIVDKDVSYFYYLDSGVRVHQVIHNIYEITNFLSLREMRAKKISFYGYHTPVAGDNFRCVPNSQQIGQLHD